MAEKIKGKNKKTKLRKGGISRRNESRTGRTLEHEEKKKNKNNCA